MNGFGNQPFAGAGFTIKKDGAVAIGDLFNKVKYLPHFIALPDNIMKSVFIDQPGR